MQAPQMQSPKPLEAQAVEPAAAVAVASPRPIARRSNVVRIEVMPAEGLSQLNTRLENDLCTRLGVVVLQHKGKRGPFRTTRLAVEEALRRFLGQEEAA